uniref:Amidase domain-containing protein n=1 Tax=Macrostomum lignano TaxID=282301 RepID=A0A1I8G757_9PLAT
QYTPHCGFVCILHTRTWNSHRVRRSAMRRFSQQFRIPTEAPSLEQLSATARALGLELPSNQLTDYRALVRSFLAAFRQVDDMASKEDYGTAIPRKMDGIRLIRKFWKPDPNPGNAWVTRCEISGSLLSSSRLESPSPLAGKRVAVKDCISVAGLPMTCGSELLLANVPDSDATVVSRVLQAGATIVGKATCEEFCFSGSSHTGYPGPVSNPHDPDRTAGGSSSGCARLLAVGDEVDLALATDQGGSARTPAAWCGVVGLKPSYGLVPYTGTASMCRRLDHIGLMARTVAEIGQLLAVLAGPDGLDGRQLTVDESELLKSSPKASLLNGDLRKYRFALLAEGFVGKDAEVDAAVRSAVDRIFQASDGGGGDGGCPVVSVPRHRRAHRFVSCLSLLKGFEERRASTPGQHLPHLPSLWPTSSSGSLAAATLNADCRRHLVDICVDLADRLRREYDCAAFKQFDFLLMPTLPYRPPVLPPPFKSVSGNTSNATSSFDSGSVSGSTSGFGSASGSASVGETFAAAFGMMGNTQPFCATGHPAVSVNCGSVGNGALPVGLMLVTRRWDDWRLLDAALGVEHLLGRFAAP